MKVPTPPPDLPKVFILTAPQHWMRKLYWEVEGFKQAEATQDGLWGHQVLGYWAANCAITAWHMTDWIWMSLSASQQRELMEGNNFSGSTLGRFQTNIRASCREIHYCREIANGSKHFHVTKANADANIKTHKNWNLKRAVAGELRAGDPLTRYILELTIVDGTELRLARDIFQGAFDYWGRFLRTNGFLEDKLIGGASADTKSGSMDQTGISMNHSPPPSLDHNS